MKAIEWSRLKEFAEDEPNGTAAAAVKYILRLEADLARLRALEAELDEARAAIRRAHQASEKYRAWVPCVCKWCEPDAALHAQDTEVGR